MNLYYTPDDPCSPESLLTNDDFFKFWDTSVSDEADLLNEVFWRTLINKEEHLGNYICFVDLLNEVQSMSCLSQASRVGTNTT